MWELFFLKVKCHANLFIFIFYRLVAVSSFAIESDFEYFNSCNCTVGLSDSDTVPSNVLLGEEIGYRFDPSEPCDWSAFRSCAGQCALFFPAFSNNFDLSLPPAVDGVTDRLGDRLCRNLQNPPQGAYSAHLYASLKCGADDGSLESTQPKFMSGGLMFSQQAIKCRSNL